MINRPDNNTNIQSRYQANRKAITANELQPKSGPDTESINQSIKETSLAAETVHKKPSNKLVTAGLGLGALMLAQQAAPVSSLSETATNIKDYFLETPQEQIEEIVTDVKS